MMPITQSSTNHFDPNDEDSWFFGYMSRNDAQDLLIRNKELGAFLIRESTTAKGDLVLSVKEVNDKVSHYIINKIVIDKKVKFKIGDLEFYDIPSLLEHYKKYDLNDTPLTVPAIPKEPQFSKRNFTKNYLSEVSHVISTNIINNNNGTSVALNQRKLPMMARVIQSRIPNAYDKTALTLKEGDIVRVTKTDISGCWEGEVSGRKGHFPFNYVKFIDDMTSE